MPDYTDNKDTPLAPPGTYASRWKERGSTFDAMFQTIEGSSGYWAGKRFNYASPKFSMNATPQCDDDEDFSLRWAFFSKSEALPVNHLGPAPLSNRLMIPTDRLKFEGGHDSDFLGCTWMAIPFADPVKADPKVGSPPTSDQRWTCFLSTTNFDGPIGYSIPETWSEPARIFDYPIVDMVSLAPGDLVELDTGLIVTPPRGLEKGYVSIVTG